MEPLKIKQRKKVKLPTPKVPKILDVDKFFGAIKWEEDAVAYQRRLSDDQ